MKRTVAVTVVVVALTVAASPSWAQTESAEQKSQQPPAQLLAEPTDVTARLQAATVEQRARMTRLVANKYPSLAEDIFRLLTEHYPGVLPELNSYVEHLIQTKYPEIPSLILGKLESAPAVQTAVEGLIIKEYPDFITELRQIADSDDLQTSVSELIQRRYPGLTQDVLGVITRKFPSLLGSVQQQVLSSHPGLLVDVTRRIQRRYPDFANDALALVLTKYPDLLSELLATLSSQVPTVTKVDVAPESRPGEVSQPPAQSGSAGHTEPDGGTAAQESGSTAGDQ